ncbi:MAG: hypothetical protein HY391_04820 [Deltaproteobacteria bacterium]|nr:hypothetical protein [Deltaproteobacteria bacterium]
MLRYVFALVIYVFAILALFFYFSYRIAHQTEIVFVETLQGEKLHPHLWEEFELGSFTQKSIDVGRVRDRSYLRLTAAAEETHFPYRAFGIVTKEPVNYQKGLIIKYRVSFGKNVGISPPHSDLFVTPARNDVPLESGKWYQCTIRPYPQDPAYRMIELFFKDGKTVHLLHSSLVRSRLFPQWHEIQWLLSGEKIELEVDKTKHFVSLDQHAQFEKAFLYFLSSPHEANIPSELYYSRIMVSRW